MLAYIKGKVTDTGIDWLILENGGIGFRVLTSASTLSGLDREAPDTLLYTKLNIKEDHLELCGFRTTMELELYENLISVSGIGTKGAIAILSGLSVESLIAAILQEEDGRLVKVPGIGKKTAQRVILELKDKFRKRYAVISDSGSEAPSAVAGLPAGKGQEVLEALTALGYTPKEAKAAVGKLDLEALGLEEAIKQAFRLLAR